MREDLNGARGIIFGILFGLIIWGIVGLVWMVTR